MGSRSSEAVADERAQGEAGEKREGPEAELGQAALGRGQTTEQELDLAEVQTRKWIFATVEEALEPGWG